MRTPRILALVAVGALSSALAACGGDKPDDGTADAASGPIAVKATDTTCDVATSTLDAGTHVFTVTNSGAAGATNVVVTDMLPAGAHGL